MLSEPQVYEKVQYTVGSLSKVVVIKARQGRRLNTTGILLNRPRFFNFCVLDEIFIFFGEPESPERSIVMEYPWEGFFDLVCEAHLDVTEVIVAYLVVLGCRPFQEDVEDR